MIKVSWHLQDTFTYIHRMISNIQHIRQRLTSSECKSQVIINKALAALIHRFWCQGLRLWAASLTWALNRFSRAKHQALKSDSDVLIYNRCLCCMSITAELPKLIQRELSCCYLCCFQLYYNEINTHALMSKRNLSSQCMI